MFELFDPLVALATWNPLSPSGLYSNPAEYHASIMGLVVAIVAIALDRRGHPTEATEIVAFAVAVALLLPASGIAYKSWYFAGPLALVGGGYLIYDRRDRASPDDLPSHREDK